MTHVLRETPAVIGEYRNPITNPSNPGDAPGVTLTGVLVTLGGIAMAVLFGCVLVNGCAGVL
jgi:hypothetical protein